MGLCDRDSDEQTDELRQNEGRASPPPASPPTTRNIGKAHTQNRKDHDLQDDRGDIGYLTRSGGPYKDPLHRLEGAVGHQSGRFDQGETCKDLGEHGRSLDAQRRPCSR